MTETEWLECTDPRPMLEYLRGPMSTSTQTKVIWGKEVALTGFYHKRISDRKSRLFGCACCRRFWHLLDEEHCRRLIDYARSFDSLDGRGLTEPPLDACHKAIELAERSADESVTSDELEALSVAVSAFYRPASDYCSCYDESVGPFDAEFVASGIAAEAVHHASSQHVDVFGQLSSAFDSLHLVVDWATKAAEIRRRTGDGGTSVEGGVGERAAHCAFLREIVGNPFRPMTVDPSWLTWNDSTVRRIAEGIYEERRLPEGTLDSARLAILSDALLDAGCDNEELLAHCRSPGQHVRGCWAIDLLTGRG